MASVSDWKVPSSVQPKPEDYAYDLDRGLGLHGGAARNRAGGRVHRGNARHRARRQRRHHSRQRPHPDHRLSDHRGGHDLADAERRPFGARPRARLRSGNRLRPGASARQARHAGARIRPVGGGLDRRARRRWRRRRAATLGRRAHRRQAGIRRLLGIRARRSDLHRAGASQLGRHGADRTCRRSHRHRFAATAAGGRQRPAAEHQHGRPDRPA